MKLQRAACSSLIWFGDLNAFAGRQLLPSALDLPAGGGGGRGSASAHNLLTMMHSGLYLSVRHCDKVVPSVPAKRETDLQRSKTPELLHHLAFPFNAAENRISFPVFLFTRVEANRVRSIDLHALATPRTRL